MVKLFKSLLFLVILLGEIALGCEHVTRDNEICMICSLRDIEDWISDNEKPPGELEELPSPDFHELEGLADQAVLCEPMSEPMVTDQPNFQQAFIPSTPNPWSCYLTNSISLTYNPNPYVFLGYVTFFLPVSHVSNPIPVYATSNETLDTPKKKVKKKQDEVKDCQVCNRWFISSRGYKRHKKHCPPKFIE